MNCPFCDCSDQEVDEMFLSGAGDPVFFLSCPECGCQGPIGLTPEAAVKVWDHRASAAV